MQNTDSDLYVSNEQLFCRLDTSGKINTLFDEQDTPRQNKDGGIFICLQGSATLFLDLKEYKLKVGDMCVVFPFSVLQLLSKSDDFNGFGVLVHSKLFNDIQIPAFIDLYLYIKSNPCISISEVEQKNLIEQCDLLLEKYARRDHPFHMEITYSLFRMIYFEIAAIYKKEEPITEEVISRKDMLVRKFMILLATNHLEEKEVGFYASSLCVTPRYLSSLVKEKTGTSASTWINFMIVKEAKTLLLNEELSVAQVADQLKFPNPSFFGQYFKRHTGLTPKKYRDNEI